MDKQAIDLQGHVIAAAFAVLERTANLKVPVRAIVIDGFTLVDSTSVRSEATATRRDTVTFLQSVEDLGVSVVLVEETRDKNPGVTDYPADVAIALEWVLPGDGSSLRRQLTITKSRYARSFVGPHGAVIDRERPAVFPVVQVAATEVPPIGFFTALTTEQDQARIVSIARGALVLSRFDANEFDVIRAVDHQPGVLRLHVGCGPTSTVENRRTKERRSVPLEHGVAGLSWAIREQVEAESAINTIEFHMLDYLLDRPELVTPVQNMLRRFTDAGFLIVAHGASKGLRNLEVISDYGADRFAVREVTRPRVREHRPFPIWAEMLPGLEAPVPSDFEKSRVQIVNQAWLQATEYIDTKRPHEAAKVLEEGAPGATGPWTAWKRIEFALQLHAWGKTVRARQMLWGIQASSPLIRAAVGWAFMELGDDARAAHWAHLAIASDVSHPASDLLWRSLWLRYHRRIEFQWDAVFDSDSRASELALPALVRSRAARGDIEAAYGMIDEAAPRFEWPPVVVARIKADVLLESQASDHWAAALAQYEGLLNTENAHPVFRGDVLHNLGYARELLKDTDGAHNAYQAALEANPLLEQSDERLNAMGIAFRLKPSVV